MLMNILLIGFGAFFFGLLVYGLYLMLTGDKTDDAKVKNQPMKRRKI